MLRKVLPLYATAILLTACSSSDNPENPMVPQADAELITRFGSVFLTESLDNNSVIVGGDFFDISATPRSEADVLNDPPRTADSCFDSVTTPIEDSNIPEDDPLPISAGEAITLSSQGNTYATLLRQGSDFIFYSDENSLSGPAPAGLTVDIPGDEFPSFTNISIPDVPAIQILSPTLGEPITPFTQFSWNGVNTQQTFASISVRYTDSETSEVFSVFCRVVDDGSFSFPTEIQALISTDATPDVASFTRTTRDALVSGNAVLNLNNTISVDF